MPKASMVETEQQITELLVAWSNGDEASLERLVPLVEHELKRIARRFLNRENANHSMMTSDLINEAYMRLMNQREVQWKNRSHFFAVASIIIRRILMNHARDRMTGKRAGSVLVLNIDNVEIISTEKTAELVSLDDALTCLSDFDKLKAE
jgi:ECF sigma factor.